MKQINEDFRSRLVKYIEDISVSPLSIRIGKDRLLLFENKTLH